MAQFVAYGFYLHQKVSNMVLGFFPPYIYSAIPCSTCRCCCPLVVVVVHLSLLLSLLSTCRCSCYQLVVVVVIQLSLLLLLLSTCRCCCCYPLVVVVIHLLLCCCYPLVVVRSLLFSACCRCCWALFLIRLTLRSASVAFVSKTYCSPAKSHKTKDLFQTLNRGLVGSNVYVCYKKSMMRPKTLCYEGQILTRYPSEDYPDFPLPAQVPLFCLPLGSVIESWPVQAELSPPVFSRCVSVMCHSSSGWIMIPYAYTLSK